ncbi:hypothetical protein TNCV_2433441 [Trichonephila clavipes]|nr:hypothetical protein TNCV_2433441 [Trichonephila clavipes]
MFTKPSILRHLPQDWRNLLEPKEFASAPMPGLPEDFWQTVTSRLAGIGLYAQPPIRYVPMTASSMKNQILRTRKHQTLTPSEWGRVLFGDEPK